MEEEKKMKTIVILANGLEVFFEPKGGDDVVYDAHSCYAYDEMVFHVDGKEYTPDDFSPAEDILSPEQLKEFKDFDVEKFFEDSGADYGIRYVPYSRTTTRIEIEIPQDEEFDPKKAAVVVRDYLNLDLDYMGCGIACAFAYDGKVYHFFESGKKSFVEYKNVIWKRSHKIGFIDKSGAWVIEPRFEYVEPFSEGLAQVYLDGQGGIHRQERYPGHRAQI